MLLLLEWASQPIFTSNKQKNQDEFYIHRFASTVALTDEAVYYINEH